MTADECEQFFGYPKQRFQTDFEGVAADIRKEYGVYLNHKSKYKYRIEDLRAEHFCDEGSEQRKGIHLTKDMLKLDEFQFLVMLAVLSTPHNYFRGCAIHLLVYMDYKNIHYKTTAKKVEEAIKKLVQKKYITVVVTTDSYYREDYLIKPYVGAENGDIWIPFDKIRQIHDVVKQDNMMDRRLTQLIKAYGAIESQGWGKEFGYAQLTKITGMSKTILMPLKDILEQNEIVEGLQRVGNSFMISLG